MIMFTPETFVELFTLCLYWQWNPSSLHSTFTTVGKVVDVLEGLGVVTEAQISLLRGDREYASCLLRKVAVIRASSQSFRTKRDCECRTQLAEEVLRQKRDFCVRVTDITCAVNKKNLVRSTRVHLTFQGALRANMLEIKYQEVLDREKYLKAHDEKVEDCEV